MAVDEALLDDAAAAGHLWLRFYRWADPTLSLGYFQGYEQRLVHRASRQCSLVRRMSGGGAILHDAEITYCLTVPVAHPLAEDSTRLYKAVHEVACRSAVLAGNRGQPAEADHPERQSEQPFLCFQRRSAEDVLVDGVKICGSAQCRRRGAIMQHGSLILSRSDSAPELPGLAEQAGFEIAAATLVQTWTAAIARRLNLGLSPAALEPALLDAVRTLALEKYSGQAWNRRR